MTYLLFFLCFVFIWLAGYFSSLNSAYTACSAVTAILFMIFGIVSWLGPSDSNWS